jgi:hypothetical protein
MNPNVLHHIAAGEHFEDLARAALRRGPRRRLRRILRPA